MGVVFWQSDTEIATVTNTFSVNGSPTDPTTVALVITSPTGTASTYTYAAAEVSRTGAGIYFKDIPCAERGVWTYTWIGTGTAQDVQAGTWTVQDTALQRMYCTVEEYKSRVRIGDTLDDMEILQALVSASRHIDNICNRRFDRVTATRTFCPADWWYTETDDLVSVTTLKTDDAGDGTFATTWSASDYQLLPVNPDSGADHVPYTAVKALVRRFPRGWVAMGRHDRVQIAGVWGWPSVPASVKQAAAIISADLSKMREAPFGIAGGEAFGPIRIRDNTRAMTLLAPYIRSRVLVA